MMSLIEELGAVARVLMESQRLAACSTSFPELDLHPPATA